MLLTAGVGCSTATDSRSPARDNGNVVASASAHRILMAATAAQDGDVGAACTANAEGNLDCVWDDGAGTSCTYTTTPGGDVLLAEVCSGYWGSYTCANTGTEIDCAFVCADGSECSDRWSLEYELIASTCDYESEPSSEDCESQEDGTTLCTWNEGAATCNATIDAQGEFQHIECTDGTWSQIREAADDTLHCALYDGDALLCEDVYTMDGEPVSLGCDAYMEDGSDSGDDPYGPDCTEPDCVEPVTACEPYNGAGQVCTQSDGTVTCVSHYDETGLIMDVTCTTVDGEVVYDCDTNSGDHLLYCTLYYGDESCQEVVEPASGSIVSSTCGNV